MAGWSGGAVFLRASSEIVCEETTEVMRSRRRFVSVQTYKAKICLSMCKDFMPGLAYSYVKEFIYDEYCEKLTLYGEN